ncbi:MAG: hypothetical protein RLZZ453_986 [Chlamydiota bacterium]
MKNRAVVFLVLSIFFVSNVRTEALNELSVRFEKAYRTRSDICEHIPLLHQLSQEVSSLQRELPMGYIRQVKQSHCK